MAYKGKKSKKKQKGVNLSGDKLSQLFNINRTGYTEGSMTEDNSYNIIPGNNITMEGVNKQLLGVKMDDNGNVIGFEFMQPNENYKFDDTSSVLEVPTYKGGGIPKYQLGVLNQNQQPNFQTFLDYQQPLTNEQQKQEYNKLVDQGNIEAARQNPFFSEQDFQTQSVGSITPQVTNTNLVESTTPNINPITGEEVSKEEDQGLQPTDLNLRNRPTTQFFNPYAGVDIPTASATLGASIANKNTAGIIGSGAKLGLGLLRNTLGAYAQQNRQNDVMADYYKKQKEGMNIPQYISSGKYGGKYQGGGQLNEEDYQAINQSLPVELDQATLNRLFERVQAPENMEIAEPNLGSYGDLNYFDVISNTPDSIELMNTKNSPHNQSTIRNVVKKLQELNPDRKVNISFQDGGDMDNFEKELLSQLNLNSQDTVPTTNNLNLGKYKDYGYYNVIPDSGRFILKNTERNKLNASDIQKQINAIREMNPGVKVDFRYNNQFQDGGTIDEILNSFNEEQFINQIQTQQPAPAQNLDLGKYGDVNYFDVREDNGQFIIQNTPNNPQNAAGFKNQIQKIQQQNPNAVINQKYLPQLQKEGNVDNKILTGEFITGIDQEDSERMNIVNGEVEAGEYYQTNQGDIAEVIGKKHSQGGEKMLMEKGDRVLTDHTKLGAKNAKEIRDNYDLDIKAKHTYSDVLDKFKSKMGLNKLVDEEEKLIEKLEKELDKPESQSKKLNVDFLQEKINSIQEKKNPIEEARKVLYDKLFNLQESGKEEETRDEFKKGGVAKMASKYNVDEETAYKMFKEFKEGGYYAQAGVDTDKKKVETEIVGGVNPYDIEEDFVNQSKNEGIFYGKATAERLDALEKNFPLLVQKTFDIQRDENGNIKGASLKEGESVKNFQKAVDANYQALINDAERLGDPSRVEAFKNKVIQERFNNDIVARGFDDLAGNFTTSRPNFGFRSVTPEDLEKLKGQGIFTYKQLVDENGNIKEGIDLSPESKKLLEEFKNSESDFLLGDKDVVGTPQLTPSSVLTSEDPTIVPNQVDAQGNPLNVALLPDQYPMLPPSVDPHLKVNRRFERVEAQQIDPEPFLEQIFQQQSTANRQLEGLSPSMKAAAQANISANTQQQVASTMLNIEGQNQTKRQQANQINSGIQRQEENARASDALNYEQRTLRAKAVNEANINNYFNKIQDTNVRNYREINNLNLDNALFDDIQYQGDGTFSVADAPDFKSFLEVLKKRTSENK